MKFVVHITSSNSLSLDAAYEFITGVTDSKQHIIEVIFLHQDGVHLLLDPEQKWKALINKYNLYAIACKSSIIRRGLEPIVDHPFKLSSITEFIDWISKTDKLISF